MKKSCPVFSITLFLLGFNCLFASAQSSSIVTGPTTTWTGGTISSCFSPDSSSASIIITIPAGVTITNFYVTDSYYANPEYLAEKGDGFLWFTTTCGRNPMDTGVYYTIQDPELGWNTSGYVVLGNDMKQTLTCCFPPSCSAQTFSLNMFLKRNFDFFGDSTCDANSISYNPETTDPFSAYIVGHTVEGTWSVSPPVICSNNCNLTLTCTANYGVPPYTVTHPWAAGSSTFGNYGSANSVCTSTGSDTLVLTIPVCPSSPDSLFLIVPPPIITDACGNTVSGLLADTVMFKKSASVSLSVPSQVCQGSSGIVLSGTPSGGIFSGTGVTDTIFDASQATGEYVIYYTVTDSGNCTITTEDTLTLTVCTGATQLSESSFLISPNPSDRIFNVLSTGKISSLQVINIQGQILFEEKMIPSDKNNFSVDLGNEAKGIYFLRVVTDNGIINKKLVLE